MEFGLLCANWTCGRFLNPLINPASHHDLRAIRVREMHVPASEITQILIGEDFSGAVAANLDQFLSFEAHPSCLLLPSASD